MYAGTGSVNTPPGYWHILTSGSGYTSAIVAHWGDGSSTPVPGQDFDGDGTDDITVYDQRTGTWRVLKSSTGFAEELIINFGKPGNLVPGDYDGDGKADPAFYQRQTSRWSIAKSSAAYSATIEVTLGRPMSAPYFGSPDTPVPGDCDGDGRIDTSYQRYPGARVDLLEVVDGVYGRDDDVRGVARFFQR